MFKKEGTLLLIAKLIQEQIVMSSAERKVMPIYLKLSLVLLKAISVKDFVLDIWSIIDCVDKEMTIAEIISTHNAIMSAIDN